jgi:hypothetical protein
MGEPVTQRGRQEPVVYDGDQKLLAFLGATAFLIGAVFWLLLGLRFLAASGLAWAAFAAVPACGLAMLMAWGVRTKMERKLPLTRWEVRRLLIAGLFLGVVLGALPYLAMGFKLEDPGVLHVASEPANTPPAWR